MDLNNKFGIALDEQLIINGVVRDELARHLGVSTPTVNRWLKGISTPNVYQLREIAHFFGVSYDYFLEDEGSIPNAEEVAEKLGLSTETVEGLLELKGLEWPEVQTAVDDAIASVISVTEAVSGSLLDVAEETARLAKEAYEMSCAAANAVNAVKEDAQ